MERQVSIEELKELYCDRGLSVHKIAKLVRLRQSTISYKLQEAGIQIRHHRPVVNIEIGKLQELYDRGLSTHKIAKELKISVTTVWENLKKAGVQLRPKSYSNRPGYIPDHTTSRGYIKVKQKEHPRATGKGYVLEHILVWEEAHQKPLPKGWVIHHINGIKSDNRPANLLAMPTGKHDKLIPVMAERIRQLEIENRQLKRVLEDSQMIFYLQEN